MSEQLKKCNKCNKCGEEKNVGDFRLRMVAGKPYRLPVCKICENTNQQQQRALKKANDDPSIAKNKATAKVLYDSTYEYRIDRARQYKAEHVDACRATNMAYKTLHRSEDLIRQKNYYVKQKQLYLVDPSKYKFHVSRVGIYRASNRKKLLENPDLRKYRLAKFNARAKVLRQNRTPANRTKTFLRAKLVRFLRTPDLEFNAVGCTSLEFYTWIQFQLDQTTGMTMENYGTIWQLDHVAACASFDFDKVYEQLRCFHWSNLSPLSSRENAQKSDKILPDHLTHQLHKYTEYLKLQNETTTLWDITCTYKRYMDGAITTTPLEKSNAGIQGNDLGHVRGDTVTPHNSKNVMDWAIRSEASDRARAVHTARVAKKNVQRLNGYWGALDLVENLDQFMCTLKI